jgi:hypothetical protein
MLKQEPLQNIFGDPNRPAARGTIVNVASQLGMVGRPRCSQSHNVVNL